MDTASAEKYYMVVFGFQDFWNFPQRAHTFATFVNVSSPDFLEIQTISWMPKSLRVSLFGRPEVGVNLDLKASLELARGRRLGTWGPYPIREELFHRATNQILRLKSGQILFMPLDTLFRPHKATNCIHALADLDSGRGHLRTGILRGLRASHCVVKHFTPWICDWRPQLWLLERLGISGVQDQRVGFRITKNYSPALSNTL